MSAGILLRCLVGGGKQISPPANSHSRCHKLSVQGNSIGVTIASARQLTTASRGSFVDLQQCHMACSTHDSTFVPPTGLLNSTVPHKGFEMFGSYLRNTGQQWVLSADSWQNLAQGLDKSETVSNLLPTCSDQTSQNCSDQISSQG